MKRSLLISFLVTLTHAGATLAQPGLLQSDSKKDCAVCHVKWVDAFSRPDSLLLMEEPRKALVADQETCLGCHDGSIADSRRSVWIEHSHKTGMSPPDGMIVPPELPLDNNTVTCRTCHSAHGPQGFGESLANVFFVRGSQLPNGLCASCHGDHISAEGAPQHPLGAMDHDLPPLLARAGARAGQTLRDMTCQSCHVAHASSEESLLAMPASDGSLCITCHTGKDPVGAGLATRGRHPANPILHDDQRIATLTREGGCIADDNRMTCVSCHDAHAPKEPSSLLVGPFGQTESCNGCHPGYDSIDHSPHDMSVTAPEERNRAGQTPSESGTCGACHQFHQWAKDPIPTRQDPFGECATCHAEGRCAPEMVIGNFSHLAGLTLKADRMVVPLPLRSTSEQAKEGVGQIDCSTCHNTHEHAGRRFLRLPIEDLCHNCHPQHVTELAGVHNFQGREKPKGCGGRRPTSPTFDKCDACHAAHNPSGDFWCPSSVQAPSSGDERCTVCHATGYMGATSLVPPFKHPTGGETQYSEMLKDCGLPLFKPDGTRAERGEVGCGTCHDPHADSAVNPKLLRRSDSGGELCSRCHTQKAELVGGKHDWLVNPSNAWPPASHDTADLCLSCHTPHGVKDPESLWVAGLADHEDPNSAACLACHQKPEWGPWPYWRMRVPETPAEYDHVVTLTRDPGHSPSHDFPCSTCHDPHMGQGNPSMVLAPPGRDPEQMCLKCHASQFADIEQTAHRTENLGKSPKLTATCSACHRIHGYTREDEPAALPLDVPGDLVGVFSSLDAQCLVCHANDQTPGRSKKSYVHPPVSMFNRIAAGSPGYLPLISDEGHIGDYGRIGCVTCHQAHGRNTFFDLNKSTATIAEEAPAHGAIPLLRAYAEPTLCTDCHHDDALERFLYFHRPDELSAIPTPLDDSQS